jgi:hypothetical protein
VFAPMTTRAKRDEILEQVRPLHLVVHGQTRRGAATNTAVSVPQPRRPPQLLPREAVELRARGPRALGTKTACAAAASAGAEKNATAWAEAGESGRIELVLGLKHALPNWHSVQRQSA